MLLVKLSASDVKTIRQAKTDGEFAGIHQMMLDRILQTETLKSFGKAPSVREAYYSWKEALAVCTEVLGEKAVTRPPFPDNTWFVRINGVLRTHRMDEAYVRKLAEYAKANLMRKRPTISFDFLICQHQRILSGEFGQASTQTNTTPDLTLYKLPEE